jgi:ATP-dependent DNA helicase RecG
VLVATTVIEVGIDVPNATVMLVEDAERYGLSSCTSCAGDRPRRARVGLPALRPQGLAPPAAMAEHTDGFRLAEIDLELRGEGEMLGVRQSGMQAFRFARLPEDVELLERARRHAREILDADPSCASPSTR